MKPLATPALSNRKSDSAVNWNRIIDGGLVSDAAILAGVALCALGFWHISPALGLIFTGLAVAAASVLVAWLRESGRRRRD